MQFLRLFSWFHSIMMIPQQEMNTKDTKGQQSANQTTVIREDWFGQSHLITI